jgi:hypothetical protein
VSYHGKKRKMMSNTANIQNPPPIFSLEINLSTLTNGLSSVQAYVNRSSPIIANPSEYFVSVTRLIIATQRIPLWQPQLNVTSPYNNGLNTIYGVNLQYNGISSGQVYMQIINDDATISPPTVPLTAQPTNGWGNVYSYITITQMINTAIATAYSQLIANLGGGYDLDPNPPYMTWDETTQLFTMNCFPLSQYDQSTGDTVVDIYFNTEYKPFLLGWGLYTETNNTNTATGQDVLLIIQNNGNNYTPQSSPPTFTPSDPTLVMLQMVQDISSPWCFVALSKILVLSSLPIAYPTLTDLPLDLANTATNNQSSPLLIDYIVNYSSGGASSFQQPISYSATSDLFSSPIKLGGSQPISSFNISIFWQNLQGNIYPLQTIGLRNSSVKLTFVHRSIIEQGHL